MKGADMKEVFEKIIEKLESEYEDIKEIYKRTKDMSFYFTFQGVNKAIEIVKKELEKCKDGHFGCNTNGERERCDCCGLTNCKSRNKIWFGVGDDDTDTNVGNMTNGDKIRSMSNEEFAELCYQFESLSNELTFCKNKIECENIMDDGKEIPDSMCKKCILNWLQSEVEE